MQVQQWSQRRERSEKRDRGKMLEAQGTTTTTTTRNRTNDALLILFSRNLFEKKNQKKSALSRSKSVKKKQKQQNRETSFKVYIYIIKFCVCVGTAGCGFLFSSYQGSFSFKIFKMHFVQHFCYTMTLLFVLLVFVVGLTTRRFESPSCNRVTTTTVSLRSDETGSLHVIVNALHCDAPDLIVWSEKTPQK